MKWGLYLKTAIAKDIERAGVLIQYDAQCKAVLSNKHILAYLMKTAIPEYENFSRDFIRKCIENEPKVGTVFVESNGDMEENVLNNTQEKIEGFYSRSMHKRHMPITIFDEFWK